MRKATAPLRLKKEAIFLEALRQVGLVAGAALLTKIERHTPYRWARASEAFAAQFAEAREEGHQVLADRLERSLTQRATEGVVENVYYQGEKIGEQKRFSDVACIVMLKSLRPHRFVEQLVAVGVNVAGQKVNVEIVNYSAGLPAPSSPALTSPREAEGEPRIVSTEAGT